MNINLFWVWVFVFVAGVYGRENSTNVTVDISPMDTNSRNFQLQGVTIGGWLLLEPYITPSLFTEFNKTGSGNSSADIPVDEYHFCKVLGKEEAEDRLKEHWDSFYNESDFADIKDSGLNMVRIPIGYWAFETMNGDPYVSGQQEYLDKAIEWAYNNDLKVWVDLHGVPGSQNGFDNSGFRRIGYPGWFNKTENVEVTRRVLKQIYGKYGGEMALEYPDTIIGIEVVNEPFSAKIPIENITDFYETTYKDARDIQSVNNTIVFHDAFKQSGYYNDFLTYKNNHTNITTNNYNIMIDHHHYEVFSPGQLEMNITGHLQSIKEYSKGIKKEIKHHPAVVGEWSAALTDCSPWLNGVELGTRYEGTSPYDNDKIGSCKNINDFSTWSDDKKRHYRKFIEMQLDQYESQMNGWIFWCWKTEHSIEWDMRRLIELELFPQPLDDRKYIVNGTDTKPEPEDEGDDDGEKEGGASLLSISMVSVVVVVFAHLFY